MPMTAGQLEQMIKTALPDAEVDITDLRGDGDHYAAHVVSKAFVGKTRVQQHQMVYDALGGGMGDSNNAVLFCHHLFNQTIKPAQFQCHRLISGL